MYESAQEVLDTYEMQYPGPGIHVLMILFKERHLRDRTVRTKNIVKMLKDECSSNVVYTTLKELLGHELIMKVTDKRKFKDYTITGKGLHYLTWFYGLL